MKPPGGGKNLKNGSDEGAGADKPFLEGDGAKSQWKKLPAPQHWLEWKLCAWECYS